MKYEYLKKIIILNFSLLFLFISTAMVNSGNNVDATPTPKKENPRGRPTPDWKHIVRERDYVPNQVIVRLKKGISQSEEERVIKKMALIGTVIHRSFNALKLSYYLLNIKNGMSEKDVIEYFNSDPAVDIAWLNTVGHANSVYISPSVTPAK